MQSILVKNRQFSVAVRCDAESKPKTNKFLPLLNGPGAKKRNASIKENLNKLIAIGTSEFKEVYEFAKELDIEHKKAFNFKNTEEKETDAENEESLFLEKDEL
jgi:hypothetical protein